MSMDDLPILPESLNDYAAIDTEHSIVYIEATKSSTPLFLTWMHKAKQQYPLLKVELVEIGEIISLREKGLRANLSVADGTIDLATRKKALELINKAAKAHCSDLHITCKGNFALAEIRVHGSLQPLVTFPSNEEGAALIRAIYQGIATSKDGTFMPLEYQKAQISSDEMRSMGVHSIRIIRGSCFPTAEGGQFAVLRFQYLHKGLEISSLNNLGYTKLQVEALEYLMSAPEGIILFTGPTGSGKTTSLYECLLHINRASPDKRLITIEDPIEYPMPWAIQLEVQEKPDQDSSEVVSQLARHTLRMDPDIVQFSELRDVKATSQALSSALMGRQIWSTLHVSDPFMFVDRMESFDRTLLDRRNFCDHKIIRGVVAQRLLPHLCKHCSLSFKEAGNKLPQYLSKVLFEYSKGIKSIRFRGPGCKNCTNGIAERKAVAEVIITDAELMHDYLTQGTAVARNNHRKKSLADKSMLAHAMDRVFEGLVDPMDVHHRVGNIVPERQLND